MITNCYFKVMIVDSLGSGLHFTIKFKQVLKNIDSKSLLKCLDYSLCAKNPSNS